ncbi:helix-hairpin-helix domain-containing protein [Rathayibacter sp. AY1D5]|uniref:ComEA family DNA-binding protein n=1 Tax=Rathayibacter sp. AY1D5 TaxID=2080546 RepID=UPI000CE76C0F|nr:helix-hairpin-helix domain-containing protein [Rathayibacter sp. AY1D5]PPH95024.1 competence protein ComEA [Rathayibacter sp. AY1D5]
MPETSGTDDEQPTALLRPRRARPRWRVGVGAAVVLVIGAAVVAVLLAGARSSGHERVLEPAVTTNAPAAVAESLYVHVAGEVAAPGLYVLSPEARVADAVAAAGGFHESAERAAVNLARRLVDGEQIVVPAVGAAPAAAGAAPGGSAPGGASAAGSVLSLSTATAAQLEELPEIGPATAKKIVAHREANGPFSSVDQLLEVPGIGEKTLAAFRDQVAP